MNYDWNFGRLSPYIGAFAFGAAVTLWFTIITIVIGTIVGSAVGIIVRREGLGCIVWWCVDVVRALPPLVLLLFMYYAMTFDVLGVAVSSFWIAVIALSLNLAAFAADIIRAAKENVDSGITDAARALGMGPRQVTWYVLFPEIIREITPSLTVLYIGSLKLSSLAAIINVRELTYTAQTVLAEVSRSLEAWTVVGVIYLAMVLPATHLSRRIEAWVRRGSERV